MLLPSACCLCCLLRPCHKAHTSSFKHRFTRLIPISTLLFASTPTPTHPFVVLAFLSHIPTIFTPRFQLLVEESILYALTDAATLDALFALYLLALAPAQSLSPDRPGMDASRLIGIAYNIGLGLGLESRSERLMKGDATRILDIGWRKQLDEVLLVSLH